MADNTLKSLRNQMMYQIFVRNYSSEGTFAKVEEDLDRIKALGTDIVYLMPIHPVGAKNRKGSLGSPYAISDYRAVNSEFGTLEDFRSLVNSIHEKGMKCIIDVVYNHTSPDSVLAKEHPEWFYHKEDGSFGNRVGDWSDIIDLDYSNEDLWDYQIETLKYWAEIVDGFRCDVAPMVPVAFWERARKEVTEVCPDCIWLAESIEYEFLTHLRGRGITAHSDGEIFGAFDISYDYDIYPYLSGYLCGKNPISKYVEGLNRQEVIYPDNYVKMHFLENHDQTRAHFLIPDEKELRNFTAFLFFQKGVSFIYAGQEFGASHLPSLFDKDTISLKPENGIDMSVFISDLSKIKKNEIFAEGIFECASCENDTVVATFSKEEKKAVGVFALQGATSNVRVPLDDGMYKNLVDGREIEVFRGGVQCYGEPIIII
ncbi:alpha-amylase family glycosyl hydrolase [Butyrivibrio sp. FC2001]|uniref:alpha-amylase family glycosyl hydrolase n=1 Tax=Butyrivibrio sp. FC2001 TaxID=1280671 RepID=UPI00047D52C3|nr:alpha-amylase family glycosyl hydrolase [Butyrivibrio sp. FC2001]